MIQRHYYCMKYEFNTHEIVVLWYVLFHGRTTLIKLLVLTAGGLRISFGLTTRDYA